MVRPTGVLEITDGEHLTLPDGPSLSLDCNALVYYRCSLPIVLLTMSKYGHVPVMLNRHGATVSPLWVQQHAYCQHNVFGLH